MEDKVLSLNSNVNLVNLIFVAPEWISNTDKKAKVQKLAQSNQLCMIAIDEAIYTTTDKNSEYHTNSWRDSRMSFFQHQLHA